MKKILLIFVVFISFLYADSLFTLDGVQKLDIYIANKTSFIGTKEKDEIKKLLKDELSQNGFIFGEVDPIVLVLAISSKEIDENFVINIDFILAEEVTAHRGGKNIKTFANTYQMSELIESNEPLEDTKRTIDIILQQFIKSHKQDNL